MTCCKKTLSRCAPSSSPTRALALGSGSAEGRDGDGDAEFHDFVEECDLEDQGD